MDSKEQKTIPNACELYEISIGVLVSDIVKQMKSLAACGHFDMEIWDSSHEDGCGRFWKSENYDIDKSIFEHLQYIFREMQFKAEISEARESDDCRQLQLMILSTIMEVPLTFSSEVIVDLDLSILTENWMRYSEYVRNIRKEYAFFPDEQWRTGRAVFLKGMLDRKKLFSSRFFGHADFTSSAHSNMQRELNLLSEGKIP